MNRIQAQIRADFIDKVVKVGEELSSKEITDRVNEMHGHELRMVLNYRMTTMLINSRLNHKFDSYKIKKRKIWVKIQ